MLIRKTFTEELLGLLPADVTQFEGYIAPKIEKNKTLSLAEKKERIAEEMELIKEAESLAAERQEQEEEELGGEEPARPTVFPRLENGIPFIYDYQIKGYFKDACGLLWNASMEGADFPVLTQFSRVLSPLLSNYKKVIDGKLFVTPRKIPLIIPPGKEMGYCTRTLRTTGSKGPRVAIASSETVPEGTTMEFNIHFLNFNRPIIIPDPNALPVIKVPGMPPEEGGEESKKKGKKAPKKGIKLNFKDFIVEWLNYGIFKGDGAWRNSGKGRFTWEELTQLSE